MFFSSLFGSEPRYIRRIRAYLQEAKMAALEHSIAAEHYQASAEMYAERARRLEEELQIYQGLKKPPSEEASEVENPSTQRSNRLVTSPGSLAGSPANVGIVRAA